MGFWDTKKKNDIIDMGGTYGKGFVAALRNYIRFSDDPQIRKVLIELIADFDPYQAGDLWVDPKLRAVTFQFMHKSNKNLLGMGWLANETEQGIDEEKVHSNTGQSTDHGIMSFFNDINTLEAGTYKWDEANKKWVKQ